MNTRYGIIVEIPNQKRKLFYNLPVGTKVKILDETEHGLHVLRRGDRKPYFHDKTSVEQITEEEYEKEEEDEHIST